MQLHMIDDTKKLITANLGLCLQTPAKMLQLSLMLFSFKEFIDRIETHIIVGKHR